jgi:hypothetical protein
MNKRPGSNKATGRDYTYDKKYQSTPERKKYRAELNKANREAGTYGKMKSMGVDRSHAKSGKLVVEDKSKNRARNGSNGKSTKKC